MLKKIEVVRQWFKEADDGEMFTTKSLAELLGVEQSDITNVSSYALRHDAISIIEPGLGSMLDVGTHYAIDAEKIAAYFKEFPIGSKAYDDAKRLAENGGRQIPSTLNEKIDATILQLQMKIELLEEMRD